MNRFPFALAFACLLQAGQAPDPNVNSRYTVESVEVLPAKYARVSRSLQEEMHRLVGEKLSQSILDTIRDRLKEELRATTIQQKITRGSHPEMVKVVFEIRNKQKMIRLNVPKVVYASRQGWSGAVETEIHAGGHTAAAGYVNDGDELLERYSGITARYANSRMLSPRVGVEFDFAALRTQWNDSTLAATGTDGIYRTRTYFQPVISVRLNDHFTWSGGVSVQRLGMQFPVSRNEYANSFLQQLVYHQGWSGGAISRSLDAGYDMRLAAKALAGDFAYNRHEGSLRYQIQGDRHGLVIRFLAGALGGRAPYFERFVAGNTLLFRGWNKFDLTPAGASRLVHGSTEYRYRALHAFYDVGSAWNPDEPVRVRNSLGFGVHGKGGWYLSCAFPLHDGRTTPMFMTGFNF